MARTVSPTIDLACIDGEPSRLMDAWEGCRLAILVEAADTGFGLGLSPPVEAAVPGLVAAIQEELALAEPG